MRHIWHNRSPKITQKTHRHSAACYRVSRFFRLVQNAIAGSAEMGGYRIYGCHAAVLCD